MREFEKGWVEKVFKEASEAVAKLSKEEREYFKRFSNWNQD